jgi:hypothetical protein
MIFSSVEFDSKIMILRLVEVDSELILRMVELDSEIMILRVVEFD